MNKKNPFKIDRSKQYDLYLSFTEGQKDKFINNVEEILLIMERLIKEGELYIDTKLMARIKDPESSISNDYVNEICQNKLMKRILKQINLSDYTITEETDKNLINKSYKGKELDDIFGINIIVHSEEELEKLEEALRIDFAVRKKIEKRKPEYCANHLYLWNKTGDEYSPLIECQLKTLSNHINSHDHTLYKVETNIANYLQKNHQSSKKLKIRLNENGTHKVWEIIQQFYNEGEFNIMTNIPRMWEGTFDEELGQMQLVELSENQTLKRMYPNLKVKYDRNKNDREEIER
ncbi:MAG: hypothetical protein Q4G09_03580 [Clostridia bacterium]|nr:hypothetical protein [Clostridia bacterium]